MITDETGKTGCFVRASYAGDVQRRQYHCEYRLEVKTTA